MLSRAFWDQNVDDSRLDDFINGKVEEWPAPDRKLFFRRLLSTYDWYTLLKLVPEKALRDLLEDDVLAGLYPRELKEKYRYVRQVLFK